jgi:hypothetical protein
MTPKELACLGAVSAHAEGKCRVLRMLQLKSFWRLLRRDGCKLWRGL